MAIRFSCFGELFTITADESFDQKRLQLAISAIEDEGFVYVPESALDAKYSGENPHLQGISWFTRYFDYL